MLPWLKGDRRHKRLDGMTTQLGMNEICQALILSGITNKAIGHCALLMLPPNEIVDDQWGNIEKK
jgi:hypothetical protein